MVQPLNPQLYEALVREFKHVRISSPGVPASGTFCMEALSKKRLVAGSWGEYYIVSCPYCTDCSHRLWINHLWGVYDKRTGTRNRWLAVCYNEDCLRDPENRRDLICRLATYHRRAGAGQVAIEPGRPQEIAEPIALPSDFMGLDELDDDHRARRYVRSRRFSPDILASRWGVGYSGRQWLPSANSGRLVIPVYKREDSEHVLYGWQSRHIGSGSTTKLPKYYTARGMKKSEMLYGIQRVDDSSNPILIVEGPTDVWRAGKNAVALFGHHASAVQKSLVCSYFAGRPLVVLLDTDAHEDAEQLADALRQQRQNAILRPDKSAVVVARLSRERDPADYSRSELWKLAERSLGRAR